MGKINWKRFIGFTLLVAILALLMVDQYFDSFQNVALFRPDLSTSFYEGGRLYVAVDSLARVSALIPFKNLFFILIAILLLNNIFVVLFMKKDEVLESTEEEDTLSFKRLHSYLSHEQKNNLAIIRMRMELAGDTETLAYIDKISHSMDDVLTLSDDVSVEDLEEVDMILLVAEVCDDYKPLGDLKFEFEGDSAIILSKYQWVYRAMSNLIDNALKFGEDSPIEVSVRTEQGSVVVCVKDHGIGIEESQLDVIFKHEYRVNPLNSDGYGIGLSLVNRVCELSRGIVWVDSEVGVGTSFYLSFPQV